MQRRAWAVGVALSVAAILFGVAPGSASTGGSDLAVAYQVDVGHSGVQTDSSLRPPFSRRWQVTLPAESSYPLIAGGDVYVTAGDDNTFTRVLYAIDEQSGNVVWSRSISGYGPWSGAAYDAGRIFVVSNNTTCCSGGLMTAFDAVKGTHLWTATLPDQYLFSSPPTASNGVVYTGGAGSGGTLYAVDEATGAVLSTQPVANGDQSSPALSSSSVFVSYACDQSYGFAQQTLAVLWHYSGPCEGGGGKTPTYADGDLFVRDFFGNLILDPTTGNLIRSFAPNTSIPAPAVDSNTIFLLNGGVLGAQDLASGTVRWSFSGDGQLDSAPIVLASSVGEVVIEGSGSGNLYALDAASGALLWSTNVGVPIPAPDEQNLSQPLTGLGAGQGLLVVPAGNVLTAYTGSSSTCPPSTNSSSFNNTPIAAGRTIWFSSVLKASGLGKAPVTVQMRDAKVTFSANGTPYTFAVPNARVTFTPGAASATTSYDSTTQSWSTGVPSSIGGNVFLSGVGFPVPTNLPGAIHPVSFTGTFSSDTPGVTVSWKWAAAVYKSFNTDPGQLGIKPVDDSKLSSYRNSDKAGTPEAYKSFVTGGAKGGGGANYTGDYSSGANVAACLQ